MISTLEKEITLRFLKARKKDGFLNVISIFSFIGIIPMINKNDSSALEKANKINSELEKNSIDAIIDDTDENFSSKVKKMNLIGAPYQIIIGKLNDGDLVEFKEVGEEAQKLNITEIISKIKKQKVKN